MYSTAINEVTQLSDNLWVINEAGSVNCYLLIGEQNAVLIDAGWGYEDIHPILAKITDKPVMLVITHGDPDHGIGAIHFPEFGIHPLDYGKLLMNDNLSEKQNMLEHRYTKRPDLKGVIDEASYYDMHITGKPVFLKDHQVIDLGGTELECILTPGHSYGHLMFLDRKGRRLFSGDQITENHNIWHFLSADEQAPFQTTLNSLKQLQNRMSEFDEIYPAHAKTPVGIECLDHLVECLEWELAENWQADKPFHSYKGSGYRHFYKTVDLIYSDERLGEYLNQPVKRNG